MFVEIRNYKTIKHMKFEFEGFASIVGQNYIGKSAIIGAVVACLTNSMDKGSVRYDEDYCEVTIIRDGLHVFYHFEEGGTYYVINGQEYKKLNGQIPPPLAEAGYAPITIADEKTYLWYIEQLKPLFVIDRDRSNFSTDLLATIFKFDSVYKAIDLCNKEIREARSLGNLRESDLKVAQESLESALPAEKILKEVQDTPALLQNLLGLDAEREKLSAWVESLSKIKNDVLNLRGAESIPAVDAPDLLASLDELRRLESLLSRLQDTERAVRSLRSVESLPEVVYPEALAQLMQEVERVSGLESKLKAAAVAVSKLKAVSALPDSPEEPAWVPSYLTNAKLMQELLSKLTACAKENKALTPVVSLPNVEVPQGLADLLGEVGLLVSLNSRLEASLAQVSADTGELDKAEADFNNAVEQLSMFKVCPACGQGLDHKKEAHVS
jgi:vacuolar-type H+-ATPase subunit I/STV1